MKEFNSFILLANNAGNLFYTKWKKDTKLSVFIVAPAFSLFYFICTTLIVDISIKLFLILIWPAILIVIALIYSPFFLRKKYINNTVKFISIKDSIISIETYKWFIYKSIYISSKITDIELEESVNVPFFKKQKVYLLKISNSEANKFYIVDEFFDNINNFPELIADNTICSSTLPQV